MVMDAPGFVATDVAERGSAIGDYAAQIRYEVRLLKRVPEMKTQLEAHQLLLKALEKNERALAAGFSPYRPPSDWALGFLSAPMVGAGKYNLYRRAMPASVIKAYTRAKALHLPSTNDMVFSFFTVHSPDESIFEHISIELPRKDPLLVGWIGKGTSDFNSMTVTGAAAVLNKLPAESTAPRSASYLIGAWDLATDLAFQRR